MESLGTGTGGGKPLPAPSCPFLPLCALLRLFLPLCAPVPSDSIAGPLKKREKNLVVSE